MIFRANQGYEIDHVDNSGPQLRQTLVQHLGGRYHLDGHDVTRTGEDDVGLVTGVGRSRPIPKRWRRGRNARWLCPWSATAAAAACQ